MKKILHIITRLDRGGSSEDVLYSYRHFKERGWSVRIAYGRTTQPSSFLEQEPAASSGDFIPIRLLMRRIAPFRDLLAFVALFRILFREKPDILHTHTSKAGIIGRIAGRLYALASRQKLFICHSTHGHVFYGYYPPLFSGFFVLIERIAASFTDRIAVLTDNEIVEHIGRGIGTREKFRIIHSGIDYRITFRENDLKTRLDIPSDCLVIGSAGRLDPVKGYASFIDAACRVERLRPSAKCVWLLIGDGNQARSLKKQAQRRGISGRLIFTGWVANVEDFVVISDIYVQPSLNEGMGKTVVLAQMLRRPVVATRVQGLISIVRDGTSGLLVPPGNPSALADAVVRLIDDPALRERLGSEAQRYVFDRDPLTGHHRFSIPYMNHLLERLYGVS